MRILHRSPHQQAFVKLYIAMKEQGDLQWLVEKIDTYTDPSLISLMQDMNVSEHTGIRMSFINFSNYTAG